MRIRFLADSRYGDWKKGDVGTITKTLALPPQNQLALYVVSIHGTEVWATGKDIEPFMQLTIFDVL